MQKALSVVVGIGAAIAPSFGAAVSRSTSDIGKLGSAIDALNAKKRRLEIAEKKGFGGVAGSAYRRAEIATIDRHISALRTRKHTIETLRARIASGHGMVKGALGTVGVVTGAATLALGKPIKDAAAMETAMLGVAKQLDGARDSSGNFTPKLERMKSQILEMARVTPMAATALAEMTAAGLRMGVAEDQVLSFTATSAKMAVAFELPAGELADQMGKIANVYKIPMSKIEELGDTINYLDDNTIAKGGEIINVLQRIGGTAAMLNMPVKNAAALGSTFLSLGSKADVAATASNALMSILATAKTGGKKITGSLALLGFEDMDKFQKDMTRDATGTIMRVLEAISKLPEEKRMEITSQLFGREYADDIAKVAGNTGELRKQIELANSEAAKGSMQREFDAQRASAGAQFEEFKNRLFELSVAVGDALLPAAKVAMGAIGAIATGLTTVAKWAREGLSGVTAFAAGAGGFLVVGQAAIGIFGAMKFAWNAFKLSFFASPIGLALGALAGAAALVYYRWDDIKAGLGTIWEDIVETVGGGISRMIEDQDSYYNRAIGGLSWLADEAGYAAQDLADGFASVPGKVSEFLGAAARTVREIFGAAVDWVIDKGTAVRDALLAPIQSAVEAVRAIIDGLLGKISDVLGVVGNVRDVVGNVAGKALGAAREHAARVVDGVGHVASGVGDMAASAWRWVTGDDDAPAAAPAAAAPNIAAVPNVQMRGAVTNTDNSQRNITVNVEQRSGESADALVRRVVDTLKQQQAREQRSRLFDAAGA